MKKFLIFALLSLISLGSFAMTDGEWQEAGVAEWSPEKVMFISPLPRQKEYKDVYDLKDAMKSAKIWEVSCYSIGSILAATGAALITEGIISGCHSNGSSEGAISVVAVIGSGTLVGLSSIPLFIHAHKQHKKYKRLKLQLEPMMSRDVMGTVSVSPGVGVTFGF